VCSCLREHTFGGVGPVRGDPHQRTLRDRQALFAEPVADDVVDVRGLGASELLFERQAYGAREPIPELLDGDWMTVAVSLRLIR